MKKPKVIDNPDFKPLIEVCRQHLTQISRGICNEDMDHYIYEAAMEAVFGKDCWGYINSKL